VQVGFRLDPLRARITAATGKATLLGVLVLLGCLLGAWAVTRWLTVPLERLAQAAAGIARGNLNAEVDVRGKDEIAQLARSFASMAAALRTTVSDLRGASSDLEGEAAGLLATATQQSALASGQSSAINETSTTVSEIAQTSRQATEHADSVISVTNKSEEYSSTGQRVVEDTVGGMEKLDEQVKAIAVSIAELSERTLQIGDIISSVKDLAERSNLLALNASLEAAKAGEHGRGFAVVAMEMRNLAEQSKTATNEVRGILSEVQRGIRGAVATTEEGSKRALAATSQAKSAGSSIAALGGAIRDSAVAARQIAANTRQQTLGVEQIVAAITQLSGSMAEALDGTRAIERAAGNLNGISKRLSNLVSRYNL
jgi:methyl-accepting chemotaxis protein